MNALNSDLFRAAMAQSSAFDPILRKLNSKRLSLNDLVLSAEVPSKEKVRILKGLARNAFKQFLIEPEPLLVEDGILESQEVRQAQLEEIMAFLQDLYATAYLEANGVEPEQPLGYYAIRSGDRWVEIHRIESAINPEILAMRNRVEECKFFD